MCGGQVAFQGTVVTIENFLAWKARFELEMNELKKKRQKEEEQIGKIKLTGACLTQVHVQMQSCHSVFVRSSLSERQTDLASN